MRKNIERAHGRTLDIEETIRNVYADLLELQLNGGGIVGRAHITGAVRLEETRERAIARRTSPKSRPVGKLL
jgi:hypothetical protein